MPSERAHIERAHTSTTATTTITSPITGRQFLSLPATTTPLVRLDIGIIVTFFHVGIYSFPFTMSMATELR